MPTLFLSSTVRDMGDLRSAMKYWLEQQGFVVFASESPDFPHALDREAVAAALAPIDDCDYYVLVVGARVGALVKNEAISVTRAEFRHARERRRTTGRPHMLHLVRREIYEARRTGRPASVSEEEWPAIQDFLDEIAKAGEPGDPTWLGSFDTFGEVVDVLRATLHVTGPLLRRALEANLQWEVTTNTRELLGRSKHIIRPHALLYPSDLSLPSGLEEAVRVEASDAYGMFLFRLSLRARLGRSALDECINSGSFLDYNVSTDKACAGKDVHATRLALTWTSPTELVAARGAATSGRSTSSRSRTRFAAYAGCGAADAAGRMDVSTTSGTRPCTS